MSENEPLADTHGSPAYALTEAERKYIRSGDPGGESKTNMEARIETKINRLGYRIDHLLADIFLLNANDYLTEESWKDGWVGLLGFDEYPVQPSTRRKRAPELTDIEEPRNDSEIVEACRMASDTNTDIGRPISSTKEFGRDIGKLAREITLAPGDMDEDEVLQDIAYGFIEGLYFDHRPAGLGDQLTKQRQKYMNEIISALQKQLEHELTYDREWAEWEREWRVQGDLWDEHRTEIISRLREILNEAPEPIAPRRTMSEFRSRVLEKRGDTDSQETGVNERGIDCRDLLFFLIDNSIESDHLVGSSGHWGDFQAEHGPAEQFEPKEFIQYDRVVSLIEEWKLLERNVLYRHCQTDTDRMREKKARGLDALDVFSAIHNSKSSISSKRIARDIGSETSYQGQVTQICTDLASREWEQRPVLSGSKDGWELTAYGRLLAECMFDGSQSVLMWTFGPGVSTDLIIQAAAEIDENLS